MSESGPMAPSLDHVGAIVREVADVAILYDAMAGRDPADPTSLDAQPAEAFKALDGGGRAGAGAAEPAERPISGLDPKSGSGAKRTSPDRLYAGGLRGPSASDGVRARRQAHGAGGVGGGAPYGL